MSLIKINCAYTIVDRRERESEREGGREIVTHSHTERSADLL